MEAGQKLVWWSWADVICNGDRLGIPNFQRGAVWSMANVTALFESMFEKSPCGSFVLWRPIGGEDPKRHGVPLEGKFFKTDDAPMWLVDGQQRTRALLDTYKQLVAEATHPRCPLVRPEDVDSLRNLWKSGEIGESKPSAEDDADSGFWCVFLPAMRQFQFDDLDEPYFSDLGTTKRVCRGSPFRRHRYTARKEINANGKTKKVPPQPLGLVPMASLLAPSGIFRDRDLRVGAKQALDTLSSDQPDFDRLDKLLPWGPLFVSGHVYEEREENGTSKPMRWIDVYASKNETDKKTDKKMIGLLAGLFEERRQSVFQQFASMFEEGRFAVGELPRSDVGAAIDAYVRINRAGIRVRPEEQALALLSSAHSKLLDELVEFIALRDGDVSEGDARSLLMHESDRQMGFAVWMSAVTRYTALALCGTNAAHWMGTAAIDKATFPDLLDKVDQKAKPSIKQTWACKDYFTPGELVHECSARATRALALVDALLSEELLLDHRMARPSTQALAPIVDLFYCVPETAFGVLEKDESFKKAMARLLHWSLLAPYFDQADVRKLTAGILDISNRKANGPITTWGVGETEWRSELRNAIGRYRDALRDLWQGKDEERARHHGPQLISVAHLPPCQAFTELGVREFETRTGEARSLQHPAVGWLYAIERRGGAREFSWQAQYEGNKDNPAVGIPNGSAPDGVQEALRSPHPRGGQELYPEKQHIVPFDQARVIVDKGGTRSTASPANQIGNLTWLSHRQNGLDGLSNRWTVMDVELDQENLKARGMLSASSSGMNPRTAMDVYKKLQKVVHERGTRPDDAYKLFSEFCDIRREWMVRRMREWLEETLPAEASWWLAADSAPKAP